MEEASKAKKAKKGFMTPERKKKLRVSFWQTIRKTILFNNFLFVQLLLRKKAAEELKKEQERKAAERRRIIEERCGRAKDLESASEGKLSHLQETKKKLILTNIKKNQFYFLLFKIILCKS